MRVPAAFVLSLLVCALAVLVVARAPARAGTGFLVGVDDDQIKWTWRSQTVLEPLDALGIDAMRVTLQWRPGRRNLTSRDHVELRRAVRAARHGVRVVLSVYGRSFDAPTSADERETYCRFVRNVLVRYTEIRDVVVWNEANSPAFWDPAADAPAAYAALLARCWDVLHAIVPDANVLTTTAAGQDPISFIRAVGAAYRMSGRTRPLFDTAGHNPYPRRPDEPPNATHDVYVGEGDYERLAAALDEAFAGTVQPTPPIWYLEDGFQTEIGGHRRSFYAGRESITRPLTPAEQATQLAAALRLASCQPRVGAFFNFLLVDERLLHGWQSGLLWADWQRKPAFDAYRSAIAEVRDQEVDCALELGAPQGRREPPESARFVSHADPLVLLRPVVDLFDPVVPSY